MSNCCAFGCRNKYDKNTDRTFHRLPKDPTLRKQWIGRICRADWCLKESSVLCSDHFMAQSFIKPAIPGFFGLRRLKPDAVPTVF